MATKTGNKKNVLLASAAAGLMTLAFTSVTPAHADDHAEEADVKCYGINKCKGTGDCGGKGHSCAGENECAGTGYIKLPKDKCLAITNGRLTVEAPKEVPATEKANEKAAENAGEKAEGSHPH